jgi:hypothetical protein
MGRCGAHRWQLHERGVSGLVLHDKKSIRSMLLHENGGELLWSGGLAKKAGSHRRGGTGGPTVGMTGPRAVRHLRAPLGPANEEKGSSGGLSTVAVIEENRGARW